jgi:hypothetical protein
MREQGFEGIVAKRRDSLYAPGKRSGVRRWSTTPDHIPADSVGLAVIGTSAQTGWGVLLTLAGGLWLLYIERERIRSGLQRFLNGGQQPTRSALDQGQRDALASQFSVLEPRQFGIVREGLPDCVRLGDQLHALLSGLGWPAAFVPEQKNFDPILPGLRIRSNLDDKTAIEVRRILSDVLRLPIGEVIERVRKMDWFEIEIGRNPT